MADYGGRGGGQSLRDALNQLYPMTGLGEYGAMFPPPTGADQPSAAIPLPQPRPPQAPQIAPALAAPSLQQAGAMIGQAPGLGTSALPGQRSAVPPDMAARLMQLGGVR